MPPRDFSEDGAANAGSNVGTGNFGAAGSSTGGNIVSDFGGNNNPASGAASGATGPSGTITGGAEIEGGGAPRPIANTTTPFAPPGTPVYQPPGGYPIMFEDGGSISDDTDGSPQQDAIQKALSSVDQVLSFGRKLHGLSQGDNEGDNQQVAGAMPTIPGTQSESGIPPQRPEPPQPQQMAANYPMPARPPGQSESGVPPLRPEPGQLPPTSNPFGKRADNDSDGDNDSGSGAISDDEDVA